MHFRVAYRIGEPTGWLTRASAGVLDIDDAGLRIDGPVPYRAAFSEIQWLKFTRRGGLARIAIGSLPPAFVTRSVFNLLRVIWVVDPHRDEALYAELYRRVGGLAHCAGCGADARLSAGPCPQCAAGGRRAGGFRSRLCLLVASALVLLLVCYVGSYYHLCRRGMAEMGVEQGRARGDAALFFYVPLREVGPGTPGLSRHYRLSTLYSPLNGLDHAWFGGARPVGGMTGGLSKRDQEPPDQGRAEPAPAADRPRS